MARFGATLILIAVLAAPAAAQPAPAPKSEKMVCKTTKEIGSRIATEKVCKTKAEWDQITRETQKYLDDYGRTGSQGNLGD